MGKSLLKFLFGIILLFSLALAVNGANDLQCFFISGSCPAGSAKLVGVENDTGGFQNAHVQNRTIGTYAYSLCCNTTNASVSINNSCDESTIIRLYSEDNSHIEIGSNSNYSISACLQSNWSSVYCTYPTGTCDASYSCLLSMAGSEGTNSSNAHIGNCSQYSQLVCCGLLNNAPTKPTLSYPANSNTVFERYINFSWLASTDPNDDAVDYILNISCGDSCSGECDPEPYTSITDIYYMISSPLCVDIPYNWTVSACDTYDACNTSDIWNFTIDSIALIELIVNSTSFGEISTGSSNDTTDFSPVPLVIRNTGNVLVNITINATQFFTSVALGASNYQFKVANNETGSINTACSQNASFANMPATPANAVCNLTYNDSNDEARIHLAILVPNDESPGTKSSSIQFTPTQVEGSE